MRKLLFILIAAVFLSGCAPMHEVTREGRQIDEELMGSIKTGITTKQEILSTFGEPNEVVTVAASEVLVYRYTETSVPIYAFGLVEARRSAEVTEKILEVTIREGKVVSYRFKEVSPE